MSSPPQRAVVLIDAQNFYRGARRVLFDDEHDPSIVGQFHPRALADLLVARTPGRVLQSVHVFRGRPDRHIDPRGNSANVKQCVAWARTGVIVHARPLRYRSRPPSSGDAEEKGVDVDLAVHLVSMALRAQVDVAIVASADTDLIPAIDQVIMHSPVTVEVAGWHNGKWGQRLNTASPRLWCHRLDGSDYRRVCDSTDYNQ